MVLEISTLDGQRHECKVEGRLIIISKETFSVYSDPEDYVTAFSGPSTDIRLLKSIFPVISIEIRA